METWQLALIAWEGLKLLSEGPAFCPPDLTGFTVADADAHWMVRP